MKRNLFFTSITISACFFSLSVLSQTADADYFDLGRIQVKKDLVQTFSIKPEYLENMPFTNLTEALGPWLYGNFSNISTVVYVVDGNLIPDVNVYSIHDIAEITLIQNALVQLNGATGQAQLVIIQTKIKQKGPLGISASGQLFLVNNAEKPQDGGPQLGSDVNIYHRYDISVYHNTDNMQYGASVCFLRDVVPSPRADSIYTTIPENLKRFRLNTYINAMVWKNSELFVNVNYTPESSKFAQMQVSNANPGFLNTLNQNSSQPENLFMPKVSLKSHFSGHWSNDLTAAYYLYHAKNNTVLSEDLYDYFANPFYDTLYSNSSIIEKQGYLSLGDQIHFSTRINNWLIEPSIDIHYSDSKSSDLDTAASSNSSFNIKSADKFHIFLLTPSIAVSFKKLFNLQAGFLENLNSSKTADHRSTYPFVSGSIDLFKLTAAPVSNSLKLYGSYALSGNFADPGFSLSDFYYSSTYNIFQFAPAAIFSSGPGSNPAPINYHTWIAEGGISWTSMKGRFGIGYNFERRAFITPVEMDSYFGGLTYQFPLVSSSTQRLAINVKVIEKKRFDWLTSFTITSLNINKGFPNSFSEEFATGDINTSKPSFTGGWMNRLRVKNLFFGLDMMYHFSQQVYSANGNYFSPAQRINCILLQNIYAGYHFRKLELYIATRNLYQNKESVLTDGNRYYGIGFNAFIL
jgi:hypothetical protein